MGKTLNIDWRFEPVDGQILKDLEDAGFIRKSAEKKAAYSLKDVEWPRCADRCSAVEYLGVTECDSVCPFKFDQVEE